MAKPNRWVDFIRKWAKDNNATYSCALSNPKCKDAYRAKYGIRKGVTPRVERERMGLEDVDAKPKPKKLSFKDRVEAMLEETKPARDAYEAEKAAKRKSRKEGVSFDRPESVKGQMVVVEPPKKKHKRRAPVSSDPAEDNFRRMIQEPVGGYVYRL